MKLIKCAVLSLGLCSASIWAQTSDSLGPIDANGGCGDALSSALQQDGASSPCWADIRTVDDWNTVRLFNGSVRSGPGFLPSSQEGRTGKFNFALSGLGGIQFNQVTHTNASAYAGIGAASGLVKRRRWEFMYEDGFGEANYLAQGKRYRVGLNRGALRANGELAPHWEWQGSLANTYGNDTLRLFAPLDYRTVGNTEAPVDDTVAFGTHSGNVLDEQADLQMHTAQSRKTYLNLSATHTLRRFEDVGLTIQTIRARADYTRATSRRTAVGLTASGAHQLDGWYRCSFGGLGLLGLYQTPRISVTASGTANGATASCGASLVFTGDAALYVRASNRDDLYVTGNRDLSNGLIQSLIFVNSAGAGIRHQFTRTTNLRFSEAALYGTDPSKVKTFGLSPKATHNGTFSEVALSYPLGLGFLQETTYRHYQLTRVSGGDNTNLLIFGLWWSPKRSQSQSLQAHR